MASTRRHSEKEQQCWRIFLVIFSMLVLGLSIAAICLAQIRNKELFLLLDTYPGSIGLWGMFYEINGLTYTAGYQTIKMYTQVEMV